MFNVEEFNLICCFDTSSRYALLNEIKSIPLAEVNDEMAELLFKTVKKLEAMSDAEFGAIYFAPDSTLTD